MSPVVVLLFAAAFSAAPAAAETAATLEADNASADRLWKCSNCPAINPALGPLYTQQTKVVAVKLAYTSMPGTSRGSSASVPRNSSPACPHSAPSAPFTVPGNAAPV